MTYFGVLLMLLCVCAWTLQILNKFYTNWKGIAPKE